MQYPAECRIDMSAMNLRNEISTWPVIMVGLLLLVTLPYSVLIKGNLLSGLIQWGSIWAGILGITLTLFVIYLFYRFVIAVEKIAAKL